MPYTPPPDLAGLSLAEIAELSASRQLPPIDEWDPPETDHSKMRIAADGKWYHDGGQITRPAMVRAFASLLRREEDKRYFLVTPHYKQEIEVEDAAFIAVDCKHIEDEVLAFRLNIDENVMPGPDYPLRAAGDADTPAIYLAFRHGCEARLDRSTWLQLAEIALQQGDGTNVTSQGETFSLSPE
ncbi:DUF1285 domain-containing protein [Aurantiacibacter sediminis]|uniref:DUF1285 domain-containing protein n=1 Tax=Aurantiacibacter sediminis TaxID=2793064 RepID=A0ABS0N5J4_9SPHN|nr:DUF1285 domain-containing protein [Aurantiacibacter sediminis]MBH5323050.1 DUF1285 domain-containing protein [Aurantiacibacter sediminis]